MDTERNLLSELRLTSQDELLLSREKKMIGVLIRRKEFPENLKMIPRSEKKLTPGKEINHKKY